MLSTAGCFKMRRLGQMKIQQMAFVLVALVVFFALVAVLYFAISTGSLEKSALEIREREVKETLIKLAGTPELSWTADDCASCIDMDKAVVLKEMGLAKELWSVPFLQIRRVYPLSAGGGEIECGLANYPSCNAVTLIDKEQDFISEDVFVALCRRETSSSRTRCELGKIIMGVRL